MSSCPASRGVSRVLVLALLCAAPALLGLAAPARADALIVDSSSTEVEVGRWLRGGDVIETADAIDLTLLDEGELRVLTLPGGRFTYEDESGPADAETLTLASMVTRLVTPDDEVLHLGGSRGTRGRKSRCTEGAVPAEPTLEDVEALHEAGCVEAARGALRTMITQARRAAGVSIQEEPAAPASTHP